jgi:hypothetical protein
MLEKWKKAVVHLECATDSEHFYDRIKRIDQQRALLDQGRITHEQFSEELAGEVGISAFTEPPYFLLMQVVVIC